ncbi:hypothetical protein B0F90DRAFT_1670522 [Multifurca ochricompacta]|uniref:Uncharacterized protein n=1 Tax=Multifurca ochricompacta TaxID=376703 RepID=A0AAD4LXQ5_9AGAM|nr:hypothetical protein B0F90DRAFT_1670522 [Multifurca ochricompacta]
MGEASRPCVTVGDRKRPKSLKAGPSLNVDTAAEPCKTSTGHHVLAMTSSTKCLSPRASWPSKIPKPLGRERMHDAPPGLEKETPKTPSVTGKQSRQLSTSLGHAASGGALPYTPSGKLDANDWVSIQMVAPPEDGAATLTITPSWLSCTLPHIYSCHSLEPSSHFFNFPPHPPYLLPFPSCSHPTILTVMGVGDPPCGGHPASQQRAAERMNSRAAQALERARNVPQQPGQQQQQAPQSQAQAQAKVDDNAPQIFPILIILILVLVLVLLLLLLLLAPADLPQGPRQRRAHVLDTPVFRIHQGPCPVFSVGFSPILLLRVVRGVPNNNNGRRGRQFYDDDDEDEDDEDGCLHNLPVASKRSKGP